MAADSGRKEIRKRTRWLCALGGFFACVLAPRAFAVATSRRSLVVTAGSILASTRPLAALAREELTPDQETCLSECVYKCSGGARGKGADFKDRSMCIAECKDKCLPKQDEGELVLN